jgi:hypothetical protein
MLSAWRESGQSMTAFARRQGFGAQRLGWWKKRLGEWSGEQEESRAHFAPAVIAGLGDPAGPQVSLRFAEGLVIEVAEARKVPSDWLAALVSGLRKS